MIYVRSRRPLLMVAGVAAVVAAGLGLVGWVAWDIPGGAAAAAAFGACAIGAAATAGWACLGLRAWPPCKLAFFRDRLVVLNVRHEMLAPWDQIQAVTLADVSAWPNMRITDWVTVTFRSGDPIRFRPTDYGLDPTGCRDLVARLRDEPELRERLPEFDSERDLEARPLVAGEATEPKF